MAEFLIYSLFLDFVVFLIHIYAFYYYSVFEGLGVRKVSATILTAIHSFF